MCGITGMLSSTLDLELVRKMTDSLTHRGPDATGFFKQDQIALGHRRLSVQDTTAAANQPLHSKCNRFVIIYNGEVYNFKELKKMLVNDYNISFTTTSDTEVVLELFKVKGKNFVDQLNGMFAIAIWDKELEALWVFRDRVGIKPFFYLEDGKTFAFASELKALKTLKKNCEHSFKRDINALSAYLHVGYIPGEMTCYQGVKKLKPGHYIHKTKNELTIKKYWTVENQVEPNPIENYDHAIKKLDSLISKSVEKRMIADVPLGVFLSGGIDSSTVAAVASKVSNKKISTFSIGFEDEKFNEAIHANKVAKHINSNHHTYILKERKAQETVVKLGSIYDEPFTDSSAIPTLLLCEKTRENVTVALSGDGGDELFFGYGMYAWAQRLDHSLLKHIKKPLGKLMKLVPEKRIQRAGKVFDIKGFNENKYHIFSQEQYLFSKKEINDLLFDASLDYKDFTQEEKLTRQFTTIERQALFDFKNYLPEDLLVKVDRASMHHSLEVRVPLLDHDIVNFASNVHQSLKINGEEMKYLLKKVLYQYVPQELFDRPKRGFSVPLAKWLKSDLKFLIDEYLSKEIIEEAGFVSYKGVERIKHNFLNGDDTLYNRVWALVMLHQWYSREQRLFTSF